MEGGREGKELLLCSAHCVCLSVCLSAASSTTTWIGEWGKEARRWTTWAMDGSWNTPNAAQFHALVRQGLLPQCSGNEGCMARSLQSYAKKVLPSFENYLQNVPPATQKHTMAQFFSQPAVPICQNLAFLHRSVQLPS